jgi:transglutaminase superfamily protein/coenzyme PQQ synthesis protein D (PqqD)
VTAEFSPPSTVRHAVVDGLRVVLDLRTERYRILDDTASALWAALTSTDGIAASVCRLAERYDVDDERVRADLEQFARRCVEEHLLERSGAAPALRPGAPAPRRGRAVGPRALRALSALVGTQRALIREGFHRTYERYALLPVAEDATGADSALAAFVAAENVFVARRAPNDCLVRSLALYRFLLSVGVPAEHVIGVRRFPFAAHAWVESGGASLLHEASHDFAPLARIGAPPGDAPPR